ncbi:MAG: hypothetical protein RIS36_470 [Pseudomonadota bacterium]|jgi:hypothetical protein
MRGLRTGWLLGACVASVTFGCVGEATPLSSETRPTNFAECAAAGGAILKSYPGQCVTKDGQRFVEQERALTVTPERACKDLCGNGTCEEIVCMAIGCPCAESYALCPADCKE